MRFRPSLPLASLVVLVTVWCAVLPLFWALNLSRLAHVGYWEMLGYFKSELIVGALVLLCMPLVFVQHRAAIIGLVVAAASVPVLKFAIGSPSFGVWPVSSIMLLFLSWRLHVFFARPA